MSFYNGIKQYREILPLYIVSEMRAQGLIPKTKLGKVISIISLLICSPLFIYYIGRFYSYLQNDSNDLFHCFIFSIIFLLFILNSLSVNSLVLPQYDPETKYLYAFPLSNNYHNIVSILISLIRSYILNTFIYIYVLIFLLLNQISVGKIIISTLFFIFYPMLPSAISAYINKKYSSVNIGFYLMAIITYIFLGVNFLPTIYIENNFLRNLSFSLFSAFGQIDIRNLLLFLFIWLLISLLIFGVTLSFASEMSKMDTTLKLVKFIINHTTNRILNFSCILLSKINLLSLFISLIITSIFIVFTSDLLNDMDFRTNYVLSFYVSILVSNIVSLPIIRMMFPNNDHIKILSSLPISIFKQQKIVLLNLLIIMLMQFITIIILALLFNLPINFHLIYFSVFSMIWSNFVIIEGIWFEKKIKYSFLLLLLILLKLIIATIILTYIKIYIVSSLLVIVIDIAFFIKVMNRNGG